MAFSGFTDNTVDFLFENRMHDSKQWYDEHKDDYERFVKRPMCELFEALTPAMLAIDGQFLTCPSHRFVSRIRRDTRFSNDKRLYRDNAWFCFMREREDWSAKPAYYFEIGQQGCSFGMGYYYFPSETREQYRKMILANNRYFLEASSAMEKQKIFLPYGERYKKLSFPGADERQREWLSRKVLGYSHDSDERSFVFSKELPERLAEHFMLLKPLYDFAVAIQEETVR